ncbi:VLRF1 family aeRF1-type release factor [Halalkalibacter urbisdiaboli]|uniref:VLRF1 family aeRF1-type release factor n=1 Tax=Halalkalibacter urbisdiaboli TaxID=1960589 RepID=UPI000B442807|nr:VLRF1 family aeRF1-type release factor [Halalkalibacter urbisdiaboli]
MLNMKELQQMKSKNGERGCLTIYLNTDQSSNDQCKGEWKIRLKNGLNKLEEYIEASEADALPTFKKLKKQAMKSIEDLQTQLSKSLVFIGTKQEWRLEKLQVPVENEFYWEEEPMLEQLKSLTEKYPLTGIIVIQKMYMGIVETKLGEVISEYSYDRDIENEDWKQYEGVAATERIASGANHRDQFDQRVEANQHRWLKELASLIEKRADQQRWQEIYLVGSEMSQEFRKYLLERKVRLIKKNLTNRKAHELVHEVLAS